MENQKCIVHNKAQLLAAVGCAFDYFGTTEIVLNRKEGTTEIKLEPKYSQRQFSIDYVYRMETVKIYHKGLRKMLANIRKTPAECFR